MALSTPLWAQQPPQTSENLPAVTVTGTREKELLSETPASVGIIGEQAVRQTAPAHPQQILSQVPGVAVAVTNGEGHTTAIRQPFTTSPLYLYLEDGLPIRATGFFNHNALYEVNIPMAGGIEVTRGPGTALYGSDAIGGIVNTLTRVPEPQAAFAANAEIGSFGWRRLLLEGDTGSTVAGLGRADINLTHTDGWRDKTAYDRQSATLRLDSTVGTGSLNTVLSAGHIDQETGANSPLTYDDYINNPTKNNFPIAYRKVQALRLSTTYERSFGDGLLSVRPYVRDNSMDLLASFLLSSDPTVSYSSNQSLGVQAKWRQDFAGALRARVIGGIDVEASPGARQEDRLAVTVSGTGANRVYSDYTVVGRIYDYDVTYKAVSPYLHGEISPIERLRVSAGLRMDRIDYAIDNHFAGTFVQMGGANFYGQVQDQTVSFSHASPKLGATYALGERTSLYGSFNTGFRAPSESQLFRPSVATNANDASNRAALSVGLKPIQAAQVELGLRSGLGSFEYNVAVYDLRKKDDLVSQRDLATNVTTSVNAGKTEHKGIELGLGWAFRPRWRLDAAWSYARHEYVDWVTATADYSGKEMEAAPRTLGNTRLTWAPTSAIFAQAEWIHIGSYWLEASNSPNFPRYPGHDLLNLRAGLQLGSQWALAARIINVTDERYADSAQISSNTPVYSPGLPRTYYVGVEAKW
jgi:outer membrane receptor protein involved in Fe transport